MYIYTYIHIYTFIYMRHVTYKRVMSQKSRSEVKSNGLSRSSYTAATNRKLSKLFALFCLPYLCRYI